MKKEQYLSILKNELAPSAEKLFPDNDYTFQQDNDPKHTSGVVQEFIENNVNFFGWWPANSPDLNPIENLWHYLDYETKDRKCRNPAELFQVLTDAWHKIPLSVLEHLVDSMQSRICDVLENKGGPIDY